MERNCDLTLKSELPKKGIGLTSRSPILIRRGDNK